MPNISRIISYKYFECYRHEIKTDEAIILTTTFKNEINQDAFNAYLHLVPKKIRESVIRYRKWEDRYNSLFSKLLSFFGHYLITGKKLNFENLDKGTFGKPFLRDSDLQFNISHSGNTTVCGFAKIDIGIDIECITKINISHYRDIFTETEIDDIRMGNFIKFYEYWTKKESISKALGQGFNIPFLEIKLGGQMNEYNGRKFWTHDYLLDGKYCSISSQQYFKKIYWYKVEFYHGQFG